MPNRPVFAQKQESPLKPVLKPNPQARDENTIRTKKVSRLKEILEAINSA